MSGQVDRYSELYQEHLQAIECYKKPAVRKGLAISGLVTIAALLVIASLAAYALSHPSSSLGTFGYNALGNSGLIACTSTAFISSVVLTALLVTYLNKTAFRLRNYIQDNKGFLYAIKDADGAIKGYLYGTFHILPKHIQGIHPEIVNILDASREIFVECREVPTADSCLSLASLIGGRKGVDFKIIDYARDNDVPLSQFESINDQMTILCNSLTSMIMDLVMNLCHYIKFEMNNQAAMPITEAFDRLTVSWQTGNDDDLQHLPEDVFPGVDFNEYVTENMIQAAQQILDNRNRDWMPTILEALEANEEDPIFIAVGSAHLFDFPTIRAEGLITRLANEGWRVEKVEF